MSEIVPPPHYTCHPSMKPCTLRNLLLSCTRDCPFLNHQGKFVERKQKIFENDPTPKPTIYCRYVDGCFLVVERHGQLEQLIEVLRTNSVLNFTSEHSMNSTFHFLDVDNVQQKGTGATHVNKKATSSGIYLHAASECSDVYKDSTVRENIYRT